MTICKNNPNNQPAFSDGKNAINFGIAFRQFPKVTPEDADTYKCYASNEYGRAVCTVVLNVIAGKTLNTL